MQGSDYQVKTINMMKRAFSTCLSSATAVLAMTIIFFLLVSATCFIPSNNIKSNVLQSTKLIEEEGIKHKICNFFLFRLDNFTDALMMNIAAGVDNKHPVSSAMKTTYHLEEGGRINILEANYQLCNNQYDHLIPVDYERYWHGYLVLLRPLLTLTDYQGIRIILTLFISCLFIFLCYTLYKYGDKYLLGTFLFCSLVFNLWIIPLSLQFSTTFIITFSYCILIVYKRRFNSVRQLLLPMVIIGGITSFFDLLTTPLLTLSIPLSIALYQSNETTKEKWLSTLNSIVAWCFGYATIWINKWLLAHWTVDYQLSDALQQASMRTSTIYENVDMSLKGIFTFLLDYPLLLTVLLFFTLLFIVFNIILYRKNSQEFIHHSMLLLVAALPFFWCLILRNHSVIHHWFVWRVFMASIFAYLLFIRKMRVKKG